ncbi:MAG TPA: GyrI-like domain-containing protein, partial [Candidatus Bathyarchaeia archaeon]|nr:GyrI-like domain-containing protein [Candidatus Bathyarchaeia archaeon]
NTGTKPAAPVDTSTAQLQEVRLKVDTAFAYCALEMTGSYDQHAAAFQKLYEESAKQGIYGGMPFGVYYNSPGDVPVEKLKWDLGFALPAGKTAVAPLVLKKWEYTKMASLKYTGEYGGQPMVNAYARLYKWIGENGYKPAGPLMETYLNAPSQDEKGMWFGTMEIVVPVQKAPPAPAKSAKAK